MHHHWVHAPVISSHYTCSYWRRSPVFCFSFLWCRAQTLPTFAFLLCCSGFLQRHLFSSQRSFLSVLLGVSSCRLSRQLTATASQSTYNLLTATLMAVTGSGSVGQCSWLTLSTRKTEKPASPTVTNSQACRSLLYSRKAKISASKFWKKTTTNNAASGSSGSGDPMLWELRDDRVKAFGHTTT